MPTYETQKKGLPIGPKLLGIFVLYFFISWAVGILSLTLAANYDGVAIIWLPTGSALVALVFIDMRLWPSIVLAVMASNLYYGSGIQAAVGIGVGSTFGAIIATFALRLLGPWEELSIFYKALKLGTFGAVISAAISAAIGVASLYSAGIVPLSAFAKSWARWVLGDSVGIFLFSSFVLTYCMIWGYENSNAEP
ncbi:MASE1 domain-containing protein [Aliisedimentitalea scapharcae]|uniref:MASE1 domain-containing protein n=1 Tax=Aliisedimentitalea scapharcae TaxID=1524259 RepID=A0ABZ2XVZ1_9RHOB